MTYTSNSFQLNTTPPNGPIGVVQGEAVLKSTSIVLAWGYLSRDSFAFTELDLGEGGDYLDMTSVIYSSAPVDRRRQRVVPSGEVAEEVMSDTAGLIVRPIHSPYPGIPIIDMGEATFVTAGVETTITSYTVPLNRSFYFLGVLAHGDANGIYRVYVDSQIKCMGITSVTNPTCQVKFEHALFSASENEEICIKTLHNCSSPSNFEGTIIGYVT